MRKTAWMLTVLFATAALLACSGGGDKKTSDAQAGDSTQDAPADVPAADVPEADVPAGDVTPDGAQADVPPQPDTVEDILQDLERPDGVGDQKADDDESAEPDVATPGTVSATGSLALSDAPVEATDDGMYILALLPPDYQFGGDPGADILAVIPLSPGAAYTGTKLTIPADGNTFKLWDPDAQGNPVLPDPFLTPPGKFTFLAAYMPHADGGNGPSHATFKSIEIKQVPAVVDLGDLVLDAAGEPPAGCKYEGKYQLETIACGELDITTEFKASVTLTQATVSSLDGGGCRIETFNSGPTCAEQEIIDIVETEPGQWAATYQGVSACNPDACKFNDDDAACVLGDRKGEGTLTIEELDGGKLKLSETSSVTLCAKYNMLPTVSVFFPIN